MINHVDISDPHLFQPNPAIFFALIFSSRILNGFSHVRFEGFASQNKKTLRNRGNLCWIHQTHETQTQPFLRKKKTQKPIRISKTKKNEIVYPEIFGWYWYGIIKQSFKGYTKDDF